MNGMQKLLAGAGLLLAASVGAQQAPQVWIDRQPGLEAIRLDELKIDISMQGFIARTRLEMTFANPNARVLEGEFVFPLAAGQDVTGYALEVNGRMRQGVVVPKETARVAFEETTRRQIDPGLAELTRGNVFRTRLYPIPAHGTKRIALEFEQVLDDAGSEWRYVLPLAFRQPVRRFAVTAEAPLDTAAPSVGSDSPDPTLRFERAASVWRAGFVRENVTPQSELAFRIPKATGDLPVLEARDALEPAERAILARVDTGMPTDLAAPPAPQRIGLWFDASGSAAERDLAREREAIAAWLARLGDVEVQLLAFRDAAEAPQHFVVKAGDARALLAALAALPLDGASNYGAIDFRAAGKIDFALIVGDGLDTFGSGRTDFTSAPARMAVLHASQRADHGRLAEIARHGGTRVLDLTRSGAAEAASALMAPSWQLLAIEAQPGCEDMGARVPQPVGAVLTLSARCRGTGTLHLAFGDPAGTLRVERTLRFGASEPVGEALAASVWRQHAAQRIALLQAQPEVDEEAVTALATRHGVVTPFTSLLVLDSIQDYLRYRIEPPEPELRAEYLRLAASWPKPADPDAGRAQRLTSLAERWTEFRRWHEERHPWLETLLVPAVASEQTHWQAFRSRTDAAAGKRAEAALRELGQIESAARKLADRWPQDGADPARRGAWEAEASRLMLQMDALREERLAADPAAKAWNDADSNRGGRPLPTGAVARETADFAALEEAVPASAPPPSPAPIAPPGSGADRHVTMQAMRAPTGAAPAAKMAAAQPGTTPLPEARIRLTAAKADAPWLAQLRAASDAYASYLELRADPENTHAPAFYLASADWFRDEAKKPTLALRILSNLAEIGDENAGLMRILGYRLGQWNEQALAVRPFEEALRMRPEEPQSYRDLGLNLARLPQPDFARAARLLWKVASGYWPRFPEIELIALHELNALAATAGATAIPAELDIPSGLLEPLPMGLRVVLTWDADSTDIDLWVIDPSGEPVYYSHPRSSSGGRISKDYTQGYGPEVFTITRPLPGTYRVQAHYFGDHRQSLAGPVTAQVEFQTAFGTPMAKRVASTRQLVSGKERIDVGEFRVGQ